MKLYSNITILVGIWVISLVIISFFGLSTFAKSDFSGSGFLNNLAFWDGGHYLEIAEFGYTDDFLYAFFPLYPLTLRGVNQIIQNYTLSAILVSFLSFFLAANLLYRLVSLDFSKKLAEKSILWLLFFPTSFFFLTAYSEGLFFLFVVSSFLFLRKGNLFLATLFAALASATRLAGMAVVLALLGDVYLRDGFNKKNWYVLLSFGGIFVYCFFLFKTTGDAFYFISAENHWLRSLSLPGVGFWESLKSIVSWSYVENRFNLILELLFAIFGLGMAIRSFRFLPSSYATYALASVALPLFTSSLTSMPRFLLPVFPIFILMALIENKYVTFAFQLIFILLLSAFTIMFTNGNWVS